MALKKLHKLKQWYSISDAAKRLSITLGEDVTEKDILQLAVEGHLYLSWFIRHLTAIPVEWKVSNFQFPSPLGDGEVKQIANFYPTQDYVVILEGAYRLELKNCGALNDWILEF